MKILLTGATGFLGSHVAEELSRRGHEISALARNPDKQVLPRSMPIHWIRGALADIPRLEREIAGVEGVIHIAGITKALAKRDFLRTNAGGTKTLVQAVARLPAAPRFFLYVSSVAVHHVPSQGGRFDLPTEECRPLTDYGLSKWEGEKALAALPKQTRSIILRPPPLYGPRDSEFLRFFQSAGYGFLPLWGRGDNRISMCYVVDAARAVADLAEKRPADFSPFCVDDGAEHSWRSLVKTLGDASGKKLRALPVPPFLFYASAALSQSWARIMNRPTIFTIDKLKEMRRENWVCGHRKLSEATGWKPAVTLEEGFRRTWEYYREKNLL